MRRRSSRPRTSWPPETKRSASASTTDVLPTPGGPTSTGLLARRLARISSTRSTSASRPMTGSMPPLAASSVMFRPRLASVGHKASSSAKGSRGREVTPEDASVSSMMSTAWTRAMLRAGRLGGESDCLPRRALGRGSVGWRVATGRRARGSWAGCAGSWGRGGRGRVSSRVWAWGRMGSDTASRPAAQRRPAEPATR